VLRDRLATAAVGVPLLVWLICFGPAWLFAGVVLAVTAIGLGEYAAMALPEKPLAQFLAVLAGLAFAGVVVLHRADALGLVLIVSVVGGLVLSLLDPDIPGATERLARAMIAAVYAGFLLPHAVSLRVLPGGAPWTFFVVACAMAADTGGYFGGRFFGRTKLFPRISPKKTVEGAIGALLGSVAFAYLARLVFPPPGLGLHETPILGLGLGVLAQLGDLVESMVKRAYGAKDSGWIFPGHGGVLDRVDSLVLPVVFTYYLVAGLGL